MTAPHFVRPPHHELPRGNRFDNVGHDAARTPQPRPSTAPAGLFAPAPEVVAEKVAPKRRQKTTLADGRPSRAKSGSRQIAKEAACGTHAGYHRHRRVTQTVPCDECKAAKNAYERSRHKPKATPKPAPVCGTTRAYRLHRVNGEPTCEPCREANAKAQRERWQRRIASGWKRKRSAA
jgi:hypothetical protein